MVCICFARECAMRVSAFWSHVLEPVLCVRARAGSVLQQGLQLRPCEGPQPALRVVAGTQHRGTAANAGRPPKHPPPPPQFFGKAARSWSEAWGAVCLLPERSVRFLSLRKMDRRGKAQERVLATLCWAEMEFGWDLMWKIQGTATFPAMVWGLLHSHLASSFMGLLGHFSTMSITRLAQLPLAARGSFSANREMCLLNLWIGSQPPPEACWER